MKKGKEKANQKSQQPLVGKFFHSLEDDGRTIKWQGVVEAEVVPGVLLLQLFEWVIGADSNQIVVPVADMAYWPFYDSAEEMKAAYRTYSAGRQTPAA